MIGRPWALWSSPEVGLRCPICPFVRRTLERWLAAKNEVNSLVSNVVFCFLKSFLASVSTLCVMYAVSGKADGICAF